jgi:hypothetical protein
MPFTKGDKRPPNAGRKPGSKNRRTLEIENKVAATGKTPLEVMLETMRFYLDAGNLDKACAFARDAAPYVHRAWRPSKSAANLARHRSKPARSPTSSSPVA